MKSLKKTSIQILFFLFICWIVSSCQEDTYSRTFLNYFNAAVDTAYVHINVAVEGTTEGSYKIGSKLTYKTAVDSLNKIGTGIGATQKMIDQAYMGVINAGIVFDDSKNPFISIFKELIDQCKTVLNNSVEGTQNGQFRPGAKDTLNKAITIAESVLTFPNLTQRLIDLNANKLIVSLNLFDTYLIGNYNVPIVNPSFELSGNKITTLANTNFSRIDGWNCYGLWTPDTWTTKRPGTVKIGSANLLTVPNGNFVIQFGEYSKPVWQRLTERLHTGCTYSITFKVKISTSNSLPSGAYLETFVRSRVIVFKTFVNNETDFLPTNIQVVSEKSFSMGFAKTMSDFVVVEHYFNGSDAAAFNGERIAIEFSSNEGVPVFDGNGVKAVKGSDTWVFLDDIKIIRTTSVSN